MPQRLTANPYLVLSLSSLFWAGNVIAGRLAVGEVSPMMLTTLRWIGVLAVLAVVARRRVAEAWPQLRPRLLYLFFMGALGYTGYNVCYYIAAHYTSAVNIGILQGGIPVLVYLYAFLVRGTRAVPAQLAGVAVTLAGVLIVAVQGDPAHLASLVFNAGDLLVLLACLFYAVYTVHLVERPKVDGLAFFTALAVVALLTSLPLLGAEIALGSMQWPTAKGWLVVAYVMLFPSVFSQVFYMRGVELIGPGRAGVFVNLIPVFAPIFAVILLGEPFHIYHAVALALVLGGIVVAERGRRTGGPAPEPAR